mgnify:CR=1 FL=1
MTKEESKGKVLLVTQYFFPENFKSNEIAFELVKKGYEVDALVSIPNYPEGRYYPGYGVFRRRKEVVNGVNVFRAFQLPRGRGGRLLVFNYISYIFSACADVLFYFVWRKYDRIIVHQTSPVFQVYPAFLYKFFRRTPVYMWVLDLWPPSFFDYHTSLFDRFTKKIITSLTTRIYRKCDKILISSQRFEDAIGELGISKDKIEYFPNWSEDMLAGFRSQIPKVKYPQGFTILMAGNLGVAQDMEAVGELILKLQDEEELKWVFVGNGSKKEWLDDFIKNNHLEDKVFALGRYPYEQMPWFYNKADAMLITLRTGSRNLEYVVPARLQSYMSSGKPIFAMIGAGGRDVIRDAACGFAVPAGDYEKLAAIIRENYTNKDALKQAGVRGRNYFMENFAKDICMEHLCEILED